MVKGTGTARPAPPRGAGHFRRNCDPPGVRPGTIERDRLVLRLCAADANEVVIAAPPGYGKSTLAAIWASRDQRPFGWISIDEGDSDPVVFLHDIALALDTVSMSDESLTAELGAAQSPWSAMLPRVLDRVAKSPERFVFVLDDVHRMTGSSATEVLPALVENVPQGSAVAIVTRGRIPHPASRGILAERVFRLGVGDLAMDPSEAATLLLAAGVETDRPVVDFIHEKTEGWPAGLYMAALALRDDDITEHAVRHFTGGDRLVTDYVTEEILHGMAAEDVDFLLATSVLTRLSGALCDDALGVVGSGATLERMASENQFVIPLDHDGEWYRYHHLFAEMLLTEMRARQPAVVHDVAQRASVWFEFHGEPEAAIEHALAASNERAADLIWRVSPLMLASHRAATVGLWLARYTREDIERIPALGLTAAFHALVVGDIATLHRLTAIFGTKSDERLADGTPVSAMVALLQALTRTDGLSAVRESAARACDELPPHNPYRVVACFVEGSAATYLGDLQGAKQRLDEAVRVTRDLFPTVYAECLSQLARVELAQANWIGAGRFVDEMVQIAEQQRMHERPSAALCYAVASLIHGHRGEMQRANEERAVGVLLLERAEDLSPYQAVGAEVELAEAAITAGDLDGARDLLDDAERRLAWLPDCGSIRTNAELARSMLSAASLRKTQLAEPLTQAELRVLAYLPTHLSFGKIGATLYISRNTVKSHVMAIYRKLGVASRSEAVVEARRIGLIANDAVSTHP